jgi:hypothetical protein
MHQGLALGVTQFAGFGAIVVNLSFVVIGGGHDAAGRISESIFLPSPYNAVFPFPAICDILVLSDCHECRIINLFSMRQVLAG